MTRLDATVQARHQTHECLRMRIYGLTNHGANICGAFQEASGQPVSCNLCGYTAEVHLLRDALVLIEYLTAATDAQEAELEQARADAEVLVMEQLSGQAWCQGIRPVIEAANADEFVSKVLDAIHADRAQSSIRIESLQAKLTAQEAEIARLIEVATKARNTFQWLDSQGGHGLREHGEMRGCIAEIDKALGASHDESR